jgi:hypothetical protein
LIDITGPLFLHVILSLAAGRRANKSFNYSSLFFFPKDSSNLPSHLRPISVSNTDNRLIANVIRKAIAPAITDILDPAQKAFIAEASIDDNIAFFNQLFADNQADDRKNTFAFFHDFKKAYDSISREYIMTLLQQIGMPDWVLRLIAVLFVDNVAFPIVGSAHDTTIIMNNGLKQGCPLSPLLRY